MKLNSHNEWDPLKAVVVGSVEAFSPGLEVEKSNRSVLERARVIARTAFPQWYLDEVAEDLEDLCGIFRQAGITVLRPAWTEASEEFETPNWAACGYDLYNVRDLHVVFGDTLIVSAPSSRFRLFENVGMRALFYEHFFDEGFRWICAPTPRLQGTFLRELEREPNPLEAIEDSLHQQLGRGLTETFHRLDDDEIIFDAANIIRLGQDVLFLISSTGNPKAAAWLQNILGPDYRVRITHTYRSSHLDSTILPLRSGTVLLNGARVTDATCPAVLSSWDKIYFTDVAPVPASETDFHRDVRIPVYNQLRALGVASSLNHISSAWAGLNVLSLDPQTVLVHDQQSGLMKTLEAKGFTVIPVRMRHCYTMLGGLHCTTLDVNRQP